MVTQEDVARKCGISVATVSRVMNKRGYISKETREKVYRAMKELNYAPNEVARSLSRNNTGTVGVILPHLEHPYFAKLLASLEYELIRNDYKLMLFCTNRNVGEERFCIEKCRASRMDGIILCAGNVQTGELQELNVPLITLERALDTAVSCIECDNEEGGALAGERLAKCGCKEVLYVGMIRDTAMPADLRYLGFERTCRKYGIRCEQIQNEKTHYDNMDYYALLDRMFEQHPKLDGVFASSDVVASQVLQVARRRGIIVPDQLKVVGFDDTIVASVTAPMLTTIHQPVKEMAHAAVEQLLLALDGKDVCRRIVFPVHLVERETA